MGTIIFNLFCIQAKSEITLNMVQECTNANGHNSRYYELVDLVYSRIQQNPCLFQLPPVPLFKYRHSLKSSIPLVFSSLSLLSILSSALVKHKHLLLDATKIRLEFDCIFMLVSFGPNFSICTWRFVFLFVLFNSLLGLRFQFRSYCQY